jgi:hypothetical protein
MALNNNKMKSKNDFNTQEEYRQYLFTYYCPTCLLSVSQSGLGGTNQYVAATNLAKELVDAVAPLEKDIPHPMKAIKPTEHLLEEIASQNSRNKIEALQRISDRYIPQKEVDKLVEANKRWYEMHIEIKGTGSNRTTTTNPEVEGDMS